MQNWKDLVSPKVIPIADRPGDGLTYQRIWEWVAYPDVQPVIEERDEEGTMIKTPAAWWTPKFRGFRAKILTNPTGGQVHRESESMKAYTRRTMTEPEYLESVQDRVQAWEYRIIEDDGTRVDVPAPGQDSWERFYDLPAGLMAWLVGEIRSAHLPKARMSVGESAGPTDTAIPTQIGPETEAQTS